MTFDGEYPSDEAKQTIALDQIKPELAVFMVALTLAMSSEPNKPALPKIDYSGPISGPLVPNRHTSRFPVARCSTAPSYQQMRNFY